jgi:N-acetylated-alpha-linked acidic dipeptidase
MHLRIFQLVATLCLFLTVGVLAGSTDDKPLMGFSKEGTVEQRTLESRFDSQIRKENLRQWMKLLAAKPHHLGSPQDKLNAEFIAAQFRSWGYQTAIEEFQVLFPTPKTRLLEMVEPERFTARLQETPLKEDSNSGLVSDQLPTYNAYSIDGDVTGKLVYVNYGVPKDYELLADHGIDIKGKVVIARYGGSWRGIKPKVAAEHGAVGCIIYSDPREDGYAQGDVYPKGAWRNDQGAQRGSVIDMPLFPGDPLTPSIGATPDARRLPVKEAPTLTKIPVLPISYADALPLLRALGGPVAPDAWRGALPITYHLGPGPAQVHLKLEFNWNPVPAYDVIAKIIGTEEPDQWIIQGNHHDAWVYGADDPISAMVALMEEARGIGELMKSGWKPKRTIVFAAWDGEEEGLLGSTEWVETHADFLKKNAVAYINTDSNSRGFLYAGGSHTLEPFINEIARDVLDPEKKVPVGERARALTIVNGTTEERREAREGVAFHLEALGSGSDFTPFLQHLGIASLNLGYGGEGESGSYHSIYDSIDHYRRFLDPNFDYGPVLAETTGRIILRMANAELLPFEFDSFAGTVAKYVKEVIKLGDDLREETQEKNRQIIDKTLELVLDPAKPYVIPTPKPAVPHLNFAPLENALTRLQESTRKYGESLKAFSNSGKALPAENRKALNALLLGVERVLIREEGLPGRPWYKHQIYSPGFYTGYSVKTLPGIREAIEERNWKEAEAQVAIVARVLELYSGQIDQARNLLQPTP